MRSNWKGKPRALIKEQNKEENSETTLGKLSKTDGKAAKSAGK